MKIYFGHSKDINYPRFYEAIEKNKYLKKYNIVVPHKLDKNNRNGRYFYRDIDIFIAEVSKPATGLGIELGWAYDEDCTIYCFYEENSKPTNSLKSVTNNFIEYKDLDDFIIKLSNLLEKLTAES